MGKTAERSFSEHGSLDRLLLKPPNVRVVPSSGLLEGPNMLWDALDLCSLMEDLERLLQGGLGARP